MKITRVGGRISLDRLPPEGGGATCPWLACPQGGNLSRGQDTGTPASASALASSLDVMVKVVL